MSGKPVSQGTYMPNMKALSQKVQKLLPMFLFFSFERSQVNFYCRSWQPLSQGTYLPNKKVLFQTVQNV